MDNFTKLGVAVLSLSLSSVVFSQEISETDYVTQVIPLQPTADSNKTVFNVRAKIYRSGKAEIAINEELSPAKGDVGYHLYSDITNGTYTVVNYTPEEMREMNEKNTLARAKIASLQRNQSYRTLSALSTDGEPIAQRQAITTTYAIQLSLLSEDQIQINLCETSAVVWWNDNGSTITTTYAQPVFSPVNPTAANTSWFLGSGSAGITIPVGTPGSANYGWVNAHYYNWDFLDDNEETTADHEIWFSWWTRLPNGNVGQFGGAAASAGEWGTLIQHNAVQVDYFYEF